MEHLRNTMYSKAKTLCGEKKSLRKINNFKVQEM